MIKLIKLDVDKYQLNINGSESVHLRNGTLYYNHLRDKVGIKEAGGCDRLTDLYPASFYEVEGKAYSSMRELSEAMLEIINNQKDYFLQTQNKLESFEQQNAPKLDQVSKHSETLEELKTQLDQMGQQALTNEWAKSLPEVPKAKVKYVLAVDDNGKWANLGIDQIQ